MSTNLSNLQICVPTKIQQERHATVWNYSTSQEKHHSNLQHKKNSRPLQSKEQYTVYATKTIQRIFFIIIIIFIQRFVRERMVL
jgi:aspartate carbamoyltransferase catalytic subunit